MKFITPPQIRAGRALISWSQQKLADASGLSLNALNNIEREIGNPRQSTLEAIRKSLEEQGVEFVDDTGARLKSETFSVETYTGQEIVEKELEDIETAMKMGIDEILFGDSNNTRYNEILPDMTKGWKELFPKLIENGVKIRSITEKNDDATYYHTDINIYREVESNYFGTIPYTVYVDNASVILLGPPPKLIVIRNRSIAEIFRSQFNMSWDIGKELNKEKYERGKRV